MSREGLQWRKTLVCALLLMLSTSAGAAPVWTGAPSSALQALPAHRVPCALPLASRKVLGRKPATADAHGEDRNTPDVFGGDGGSLIGSA